VDFELNEIEAAVQATARAFARDEVAPQAAESDRTERFPEGLVRKLGELGLLAVNVPAALGGSEAGPAAYALALIELSAVDRSVAVVAGVTNMVAELVTRYGTPAQQERHVPRLASAEWPAGAFALSEPGCGSDPASLTTRAERRGDGWALTGEKAWVTSGDVAGVVVVWARTGPGPHGITAFLVEAGTPGLTVGRREEKMGLRASHTVGLSFEECLVPDSARLGEVGEGLRIALSALDGGRIGIAAQSTGTIRAALEASAAYARERRTFGKAIGEHQAVAFLLADLAVDHDTARLLTLRAAAQKGAGRPFTREAAMAKLWASEAAQRAVSAAVQIHGGNGYVEDYGIARLYRDARVQTIYEGTSQIQRLVIGRGLLREP